MARKRSAESEPEEPVDLTDEEAGEVEETEGRGRGKRKRETHAITDLGVALTQLGPEKVDALPLPDRLRDAIAEARRLTSFGAQRRQTLFIGKLMRKLDEDALAAVRSLVDVDRSRAALETAALHRVERWRDALVAEDAALQRWLDEHPATDAQQLRALVRQARKDAKAAPAPGEKPRQGRAYRQIFLLVRAALATPAAKDAADQ
jgi:ribosome-associated protein